MVTIVPKEVYEKLNSTVNEDSESKKTAFSFKDFQDNVFHYSYVKDYLQDKNIDFVGEGSGRIAFMIPKGSSIDAKKSAVCFKVAKNIKGIAQNKAEHEVITKFKKYPCVPEIFAYDKGANIGIELELGRKVSDEDIHNFFSEWKEEVEKTGFILTKDGIINDVQNAEDIYEYIRKLRTLRNSGIGGKNLLKIILKKLNTISSKHAKYLPFTSLFEVLFIKNAVNELEIGDFGTADNWAFINRNNENVLLPIDWGFTKEVADKYY